MSNKQKAFPIQRHGLTLFWGCRTERRSSVRTRTLDVHGSIVVEHLPCSFYGTVEKGRAGLFIGLE